MEIMNEKPIIIDKIISIEWDMFASVNEGKERASCQEDKRTFVGMRAAQFSAWSLKAVASYLNDLEKARQNGRNLLEEKYIHMEVIEKGMRTYAAHRQVFENAGKRPAFPAKPEDYAITSKMKTTEPSRYDALLSRVTRPTDASIALAGEVTNKLLEQTRVLFEKYPNVSGCGRPLYTSFDNVDTSIETYQFSELLTYSETTITALYEHIAVLENVGVSLARVIFENTVMFYGYDSLETAEAAMKESDIS